MDMIHTISNASEKSVDRSDANRASHPSRTISRIESDDLEVFPARSILSTSTEREGTADNPAEILPYVEPEAQTLNESEDDNDDEDDYEYEDEDDAPFSGFLVNNPSLPGITHFASATEEAGSTAPATIRDEDETQADIVESISECAVSNVVSRPSHSQKWRQPSKAAVSMSLRAEQETTGGKRRLAQDLYRIMNQDTQEAGFSLQPAEEDSMKKWTIKLFQFDEDSNLAKDMLVLGVQNVELEMSFPEQYPFEPPFVRVVKPRFKRQTGFVMNGAICMELLTKDGWSPINDIESVIVSIRSLLPVGDGRIEAAVNLSEAKYNALLEAARQNRVSSASTATVEDQHEESRKAKRKRSHSIEDVVHAVGGESQETLNMSEQQKRLLKDQGGGYSVSEAQAAYSHLSDYHKKKGWDTSGWWARKG